MPARGVALLVDAAAGRAPWRSGRVIPSPAGLAAWLLEKHTGWTDCDGDAHAVFSADELLTRLLRRRHPCGERPGPGGSPLA